MIRAFLLVPLWSSLACAQVASIKISQYLVGKDARQSPSVAPGRIAGKNVPLRDLIVEAYDIQPFQVIGPSWLDEVEYDIDARTDTPGGRDQLRAMLRNLLAERFHLSLHRETKEIRVYQLLAEKTGPKLKPSANGKSVADLAVLLSIQLSIPPIDDPTRPSRATGALVPVIDKTGIEGTYDFRVGIRPEAGMDEYALWQQTLREHFGLHLESLKTPVEMLIVDRADRTPTAN